MNSNPEDAVADLLSTVPWRELRRADSDEVGAESVPACLAVLIRSEDESARQQAADLLYCAVANQTVAGEVTPDVARILVTVLRERWCVDREKVYFLITAIQQCQGWNVRDSAAGRSLIVALRRQVVEVLPTCLSDLDNEDTRRSGGWLFELLFELAGRYSVVVDRLADAVADAGSVVPPPLAEAYRNVLEHRDEHLRNPEDCFCGQRFWDMLATPEP